MSDNDTLLRCLRHRVPDPRRGYKSEATVPLNPHGEPAADRIEELESYIEKLESLIAFLRHNVTDIAEKKGKNDE